jgi:hypothetical protein
MLSMSNVSTECDCSTAVILPDPGRAESKFHGAPFENSMRITEKNSVLPFAYAFEAISSALGVEHSMPRRWPRLETDVDWSDVN